jgi:hypothetical protein
LNPRKHEDEFIKTILNIVEVNPKKSPSSENFTSCTFIMLQIGFVEIDRGYKMTIALQKGAWCQELG